MKSEGNRTTYRFYCGERTLHVLTNTVLEFKVSTVSGIKQSKIVSGNKIQKISRIKGNKVVSGNKIQEIF